MNRLTHLAAAALVASAGASLFAAQQPAAHEHATMKPLAEATADIAGDGITGTATLAEYQHGDSRLVQIHLTVSGLKPGQHGVHLHAVGKCEAPFTSAGGHYDPGYVRELKTQRFKRSLVEIHASVYDPDSEQFFRPLNALSAGLSPVEGLGAIG